MMKKLAMLIAVIMMLALCACTNDPAFTTEPSPPPSAPTEPSGTPSTEPSTEPSAVPNAIPTEISRVVTLGGEDITDRVRELWEFVNSLYILEREDAESVRWDLHPGYEPYAPVEGFEDTVPDYLSRDGIKHLMTARFTSGLPVFIEWDDDIYRFSSTLSTKTIGDFTGVTALKRTETDMQLLIQYIEPTRLAADDPSTATETDYEYVFFNITLEGGAWLIDSYEYPGIGVNEGYTYLEDEFGVGDAYEYFIVYDNDVNDIYDRVFRLWNLANDAYNVDTWDGPFEMVLDVDIFGGWPYYDELVDFEEVMAANFTDNAREQLLSMDYYKQKDGKVYRKAESYSSGYGVSGIPDIRIVERADDRMTFAIKYMRPSGLASPSGVYGWADFTIAKGEDGVWRVDDYFYVGNKLKADRDAERVFYDDEW